MHGTDWIVPEAGNLNEVLIVCLLVALRFYDKSQTTGLFSEIYTQSKTTRHKTH